MSCSRARTLSTLAGCCVALAACGSTGAPSGTVTNGASISPKHRETGFEFSKCMRSHGVPNFPDPTPGGGIQIDAGSGINPRSPAFQSAQRACRSYLPNGGSPRTLTAAQKRAALAFAQCMRTHGEPDFPDPTTNESNDTPALAFRGMVFPVGPGLDPGSPAFKRAMTACGVTPPG